MAFLDFRETMAGAAGQAGETPVFEPREWTVIEMARRDGLASLREPGRLSRLRSLLFGEGVNRRLADPRLETLRRVAVLAWHRGYALPEAAVASFREAGFSLDQLELLLAGIGAGRLSRGGRMA